MPFRVGPRQRWPRNKHGGFWRSAHASQRIYDNPAHAGWTDILPVDIALQRQPNLTWPGIIWPPQPISKPWSGFNRMASNNKYVATLATEIRHSVTKGGRISF